MGMKNSKTTILTVPEMKLHESAPPLLGPALGVQKPVIKKLKENFLRSLIIESFKYENINIWATSGDIHSPDVHQHLSNIWWVDVSV